MTHENPPTPTEIRHRREARVIDITWNSGETFHYTTEYLRVACPCADCRGHSPSQAKLIDGKQGVEVTEIQPVGLYAIKLFFSDGHDTGVFSWETLHELGKEQATIWANYLEDLARERRDRETCTVPGRGVACDNGNCKGH